MKTILIISNVLSGIIIFFALIGCIFAPIEFKGHCLTALIGWSVGIVYNCMFLNWITYVETHIERLENKFINLSNRIERRTYTSNDIPNQKRLIIKQKQPIQNLNAPLDYLKIPATYRVECPKCNNMLTVYDDDVIVYCNKCGQKIQIN